MSKDLVTKGLITTTNKVVREIDGKKKVVSSSETTKAIIIVDWANVPNGTKFGGTIMGAELEGRILIDKGGNIFMCQDNLHGMEAPNKLGYKHSYLLGSIGEKEHSEFSSDFYLELDPDFVMPKLPEVMKNIAGYDLTIQEGSIQVGCQTISNEVVREIASKLIDK